jgi:hypothetical protein
LDKINRIKLFLVNLSNNTIECIKYSTQTSIDSEIKVEDKDTTIITILLHIQRLEIRINELEMQVDVIQEKARDHVRNKKNDSAKICLKQKKLYIDSLSKHNEMKLTLENQVLDIKNMDSNVKIYGLMNDSIKAAEKLKLDVGTFEITLDKFKDMRQDNEDINEAFKENSTFGEELDEELNELMQKMEKKGELSNKKEKVSENININYLLPNARKDEEEDLDKMIAELNK